MLHALLHRKLDPTTLEPQRLEDALTSTVFGTLIWMEAWDVLAQWLCPKEVDSAQLGSQARECWFWPRLSGVEPDVVLRLGDVLVVVEAKLRSKKGGSATNDQDEDPNPRDQLVRQYWCIAALQESRTAYSESMESAIAQCRLVQAYVVDGRRLLRARSECEESRRQLPPATSLEVVTWQRLFRLIAEAEIRDQRWATDLMAYLTLANLDTYQGIRKTVAVASALRGVASWRARRSGARIRQAAAEAIRTPPACLLAWRDQTKAGTERWGTLARDSAAISRAGACLVLTWRGTVGGSHE